MSDEQLMVKIRHEVGRELTVAVRGLPLPSAFLAALVANESAGERLAHRFEPNVYRKVTLAALGKETFADWSLSREIDQSEWLLSADAAIPGGNAEKGRYSFTLQALKKFAELSTSWSYTQIMGWHALEWRVPVEELTDPAHHFRYAVRLAVFFGQKYGLDLSTHFEPLFRCWNTGRPGGKTYDPNYVANGLNRLRLYEDLNHSS